MWANQMGRVEMGHIDGPNNNGAAVRLMKSWDEGRKGEIFSCTHSRSHWETTEILTDYYSTPNILLWSLRNNESMKDKEFFFFFNPAF